ncbi:MAG: hypothetical protein ACOVQ2_00810 [Flavobacterium sp.]
MNLKTLFFGLVIVFLNVNCNSDSESDLKAPTPILVNYKENIKPIMSVKCNYCHNGQGLTSYLTYEETKNSIIQILNRIQKNEGEAGFMPSGRPKLSQSDINTFLKWQTDGLLE